MLKTIAVIILCALVAGAPVNVKVTILAFMGTWVLSGAFAFYGAGQNLKRAKYAQTRVLMQRQRKKLSGSLVGESALFALLTIISLMVETQ